MSLAKLRQFAVAGLAALTLTSFSEAAQAGIQAYCETELHTLTDQPQSVYNGVFNLGDITVPYESLWRGVIYNYETGRQIASDWRHFLPNRYIAGFTQVSVPPGTGWWAGWIEYYLPVNGQWVLYGYAYYPVIGPNTYAGYWCRF
jgi:hypothetical protein